MSDWSSDGRFVAYSSPVPDIRALKIWVAELDGPGGQPYARQFLTDDAEAMQEDAEVDNPSVKDIATHSQETKTAFARAVHYLFATSSVRKALHLLSPLPLHPPREKKRATNP